MSHKEKRLSLKKKVESAPSQHIEDDLHGDNSHVFITRDGHTKIVSKEEKARLEWQKKNHEIHDEKGIQPPAPSRPHIVKKSFDRVSIAINWRPPDEYCHPSKVKYALLKWDYAKRKETFFYEEEAQENIGVTLYKHEAQEMEKKIVNKKIKFITISNLVPGQRYEFKVRFMYDSSVTGRIEDAEKDAIEGKQSLGTEVHLPMRILSCTKCAATLLWGLEVCPRCAGEASQMPWMSGGKKFR